MNLDKLTVNREKLNDFIESLSFEENGTWLLGRLYSIRNKIDEDIKTQKIILEQDEEIRIPGWVNDEEFYILKKDGIQYILHKYKEDKDGSFHVYSYAYLPYKNGYIEFCVRMLGKDRFGDRIFTSSNYYKTRKCMYPYYNKEYGKGNHYPIQFENHVEFIIKEFNKLEEVNGNFNPIHKRG